MTPEMLSERTGVRWLTLRDEAKTGKGIYLLLKNKYIVLIGGSDDIPGSIRRHRGIISFDQAVWVRIADRGERRRVWEKCAGVCEVPDDDIARVVDNADILNSPTRPTSSRARKGTPKKIRCFIQ